MHINSTIPALTNILDTPSYALTGALPPSQQPLAFPKRIFAGLHRTLSIGECK